MKKAVSKISFLLLLLFIAIKLVGQDMHFSQFYASPLSLNPAMTGFFKGSVRLGLNYRNQWASVPIPYRTFSGWGDVALLKDKLASDKMGAGLFMLRDVAGDGNLTTTKVFISTAYHKLLSQRSAHFLLAGFGAGLVQKKVDISRLIFDNQWSDAGFDKTLSNGENSLNNTLTYFDLKGGIMWSYAYSNKFQLYAGFAIFHLLQPKETFHSNGDNQIRMRHLGNVGSMIGLNERLQLHPRVIYMTQRGAQEIVAGINLAYQLTAQSEYPPQLYLGVWQRHQDATIPMVGLEYRNFLFGLSYDINTSALRPASRYKGGVEMSFIYVRNIFPPSRPYSRIPCPRI